MIVEEDAPGSYVVTRTYAFPAVAAGIRGLLAIISWRAVTPPCIMRVRRQRMDLIGDLRNNVELGQTKQRIDDLHFYLYERPLHPELFHIHQVKHIEHRRYHAEIWIIGLAHVVMVQLGKHGLTELIADANELLPKAGLVTSFRFRGERDHSQSFSGDVRYILSTQVERMSSNLFPSSHRDLIRYGESRGMLQSFDEWESDGLAPFTFIDYEAREREFHVHAYHAFPEGQTLLKTQSIFEVAPSRRHYFDS